MSWRNDWALAGGVYEFGGADRGEVLDRACGQPPIRRHVLARFERREIERQIRTPRAILVDLQLGIVRRGAARPAVAVPEATFARLGNLRTDRAAAVMARARRVAMRADRDAAPVQPLMIGRDQGKG